MDEQRYVVEITRPVPPEKVGQVAQRIAERLNVPQERIVTLLEGRVGAVTKPVLADKADAIAEVFAEAGVRVIVAPARIEPPPYVERFGEPPDTAAPEAEQHDEPYEGPAADVAAEHHETSYEADAAADGATASPEHGTVPDEQPDDPPWGQDVAAWGFDADETDDWGERVSFGEPADHEASGHEASGHEPASHEPASHEPEAHAVEEVLEEEADRLGPVPRRAPFGDEAPARGGYAASTRWTPSPHDPYAFTPEDAPGYEGKRAAPVGPARTTPLEPDTDATQAQYGRQDDLGFFSPEEPGPRDSPRLRVYLLWALALSLLVLILLQFVLALRVDGVEVIGAYGAGLAAYRKGDFGEARRVWEPLADAGNADAQYYLGYMAQKGLGQPWSNARAANWYRRAAQQDHPAAQLALGDLYLKGLGVELDPRVGAAWYASAAVAGDPTGQYEYAKLLLHGVGVEQDLTAAYRWFEAAAANGVAAAADYVSFAGQ